MNPEERPVMFINVGKYYDAEQVRENKKRRTFKKKSKKLISYDHIVSKYKNTADWV
jgi:thioredoxin-related protein